jgi:hypothetical protein
MTLRLFRVGDESISTVYFPIDLYDRCVCFLLEFGALFPRLLFPVRRFLSLALVESLAAAAAGRAAAVAALEAAFFFIFVMVLCVFWSLGFLLTEALDF